MSHFIIGLWVFWSLGLLVSNLITISISRHKINVIIIIYILIYINYIIYYIMYAREKMEMIL